MPSYEHKCQAEDCGFEWEDSYSIKADPPKICPKCGKETAQRLISLGGKGIVELSGQELVDKVKADARQLKKDMHKSEKIYANMLGESTYQNLQTKIDKKKR